MESFTYIIFNISTPILILIGIGYAFQKIFSTDRVVLTKLLIYFILPITVFVKILNADVSWALFGQIAAFVLLLMLAMYLVSLILSMLLHDPKSRRNALGNAMMFANTGNYGLPLIELSFSGNPLSSASQLIVMIINNLTRNTIGVFRASTGNSSAKQALKNVAKMPVLYAIALAFVFKSLHIPLPAPVLTPLNYVSNAFVAFALISLGTQLVGVSFSQGFGRVAFVSAARVILSPLFAFGLVLLLGIDGLLAKTLIIGASAPTAVNTVHIAREFDNEPGFAAQIVLFTTLLVTLTLPVIIWFVGWYFA